MGDIVMYILVNNDLKMGKGKIGAQVGHGVQYIMEELLLGSSMRESQHQTLKRFYHCWKRDGSKKIVLRATLADIDNLYNLYRDSNTPCRLVVDAGHTQVPADSTTCLVFFPHLQNTVSALKAYKLL